MTTPLWPPRSPQLPPTVNMVQWRLEDDLKALRELFSDPSRWTRGVEAKDSLGRIVLPLEEGAVCFCLLGGILRVTDDDDDRSLALTSLLEEALPPLRYQGLDQFNDSSEHAQVLALIETVNHNLCG